MKKIELVTVGEIKFPGLRELEKKYLQSLNYFVKFQLQILKESRYDEEEKVLEDEGNRMKAVFLPTDRIVALDRRGKNMDSLRFSTFISEQINYFPGRLLFLIGGFAGLSPSLEPHLWMKLSFSELTFPHDLFRILFLEQLYRAFTIIQGIRYHR